MKLNSAPSLAVCMPLRSWSDLQPETRHALQRNLQGFAPEYVFELGRGVVDARNALTARVRAMRPRPRFVVWVDSDAWFPPDALSNMREVGESNGPLSLVAAPACEKAEFYPALAWKTEATGSQITLAGLQRPEPIPVARVGAHLLFHETALLDALPDRPWNLRGLELIEDCAPRDPVQHLIALSNELETSEDLAFCRGVLDAGGAIWLDPRVLALHVVDGYGFRPFQSACRFIEGAPYVPTSRRTVGDYHLFRDPDLDYGSDLGRVKDYVLTVVPRLVGQIINDKGHRHVALQRLRDGGAAAVADRIAARIAEESKP